MKTIKAKVHRLPTNKSNISLGNSGKGLIYHYGQPTPDYTMRTYQHLYITTDEEIKEGDWIMEYGFSIKYDGFPLDKSDRKIIATTDPELIEGEWVGDKDDFQDFKDGIPQIPQSFIEEYCKAGGIDEVLVEYIGVTGFCNCKELGFLEIGHSIDCDTRTPQYYIPNLKDNTIIIHPVEEKKVSEFELKVLAVKLIQLPLEEKMKITDSIEAWDKWIEENL